MRAVRRSPSADFIGINDRKQEMKTNDKANRHFHGNRLRWIPAAVVNVGDSIITDGFRGGSWWFSVSVVGGRQGNFQGVAFRFAELTGVKIAKLVVGWMERGNDFIGKREDIPAPSADCFF